MTKNDYKLNEIQGWLDAVHKEASNFDIEVMMNSLASSILVFYIIKIPLLKII